MFSTIDLRQAYYQIPLSESDRPYTAFEGDGKLLQCTRMPFGITNGVPCYQRKMDEFILWFDKNLELFLSASKADNLTFNEDKCIFSTFTIDLLGYRITPGMLQPDPNRLKPLLDLKPQHDAKSLQRVVGMFAYYARWISNFSDKIKLLNSVSKFPLNQKQISVFQTLKHDLASAAMHAMDEDIPFTLETDASDFVIAATLPQAGRPVAFHSRSEQFYSSVEKEAQVIFESVNHCRHLLLGQHFTLITDQRSVAYMYDTKNSSKIKNDKILRWRIELSPIVMIFNIDPGKIMW